MKPENFEKQSAKNIARVKILIKAHLSWLNGFPYHLYGQLTWLVCDSGFYSNQFIKVDSKILSKAQRTVNTLYKDYPMALPAVVGHADLWHKRCCEYINFAKTLINQNPKKIPSLFELDSKYQSTIKQEISDNSCDEIIAQLSWKFYISRTGLRKSLTFFDQFNLPKHNIDHQDLINLISIYSSEPTKSIHFIQTSLIALTNICSSTYQVFFSTYLKSFPKKNYQHFINNFKPVEWPKITNKYIVEALEKLNDLKPVQRRRFFQHFENLPLAKSIHEWDTWWSIAKPICQKIENHLTLSKEVDFHEVKHYQEELSKHISQMPCSLDLREVFDILFSYSEYKNLNTAIGKISKTINALNPQSTIPYLLFFKRTIKWSEAKSNHFATYLSGLNYFLSHTGAFNPQLWGETPQTSWFNFDSKLLEESSSNETKSFFHTLTELYLKEGLKLTKRQLPTILNAIKASYQNDEIISLLSALEKSKIDEEIPVSVTSISRQLDLKTSETIRLIGIQKELFNHDTWTDELDLLFNLFKDLNEQEFFKRLLLNFSDKQIHRINYLTKIIRKCSGKDAIPKVNPIQPQKANWLLSFPSEFHTCLEELNSLTTNAQKVATTIFKKVWWSKAMLQNEIVNLNSLKSEYTSEDGGHVAKRIANLQNQLEYHQEISVKQTQKIKSKLLQKINLSFLSSWEKDLEKQFNSDWCSFLGMEMNEVPAWLVSSQVIGKLVHIIEFDSSSKSLAKKVIKQRVEGKFYYLNNHKSNLNFINSIAIEGINLVGWSSKIQAHSYTAKNGASITINIEPDPLNVLDMGGHFSTCLSPGSMNYFSVFTNIADINKAVIYAKDESERVIGRVLIGITDQGGLQVFNQYTHNKEFEFEEHVQPFIAEIACQTNLTVTRLGTVRPLCSKDWYDDGADNISHGIECFKDNSVFRKQIPDLSPDEFEQCLIDAIKPKKLNSIIFATLINLPEIEANSSLYPTLLKFSLTIPNLATVDCFNFYDLACSYGKGAECYESHRKRLIHNCLKRVKERWINYDEVELIAEHHPSDALRIIKADAKLRKTNWKQKPLYEAINATSIALKSLGRNKLAEKILNRSNESNGSHFDVQSLL